MTASRKMRGNLQGAEEGSDLQGCATAPPSQLSEAPQRQDPPRSGILVKTKMCRFHIVGVCAKGEDCSYAHDPEELKPLPNLYRTKVCKRLIGTGNCNDPQCRYAHSKSELRNTSFLKRMERSTNGGKQQLPEVPLGGSAWPPQQTSQPLTRSQQLQEQHLMELLSHQQQQRQGGPVFQQQQHQQQMQQQQQQQRVYAVPMEAAQMPYPDVTKAAYPGPGLGNKNVQVVHLPQHWFEAQQRAAGMPLRNVQAGPDLNATLQGAAAAQYIFEDKASGKVGGAQRMNKTALPTQGRGGGPATFESHDVQPKLAVRRRLRKMAPVKAGPVQDKLRQNGTYGFLDLTKVGQVDTNFNGCLDSTLLQEECYTVKNTFLSFGPTNAPTNPDGTTNAPTMHPQAGLLFTPQTLTF
jgi:hypothetical protein